MDLAIQGGLSPPRLPVSPPGPSNVADYSRTTPAVSRVPILPTMSGRVVRSGWFAVGWIAVAIGTIGIVVPGLPTTVFFIVAAACFSRSSPRFEQWVLDRPGIGPMVGDYRSGLGMPRSAKTAAIASIASSVRSVPSSPRAPGGCKRSSSSPAPSASAGSSGASRSDRTDCRIGSCPRWPAGSGSPRSPRRSPGSDCSSAWPSSTSGVARGSVCTSSVGFTASSYSATSPSRWSRPSGCAGAAARSCTPCWRRCRPAPRSCSRHGPTAPAACSERADRT